MCGIAGYTTFHKTFGDPVKIIGDMIHTLAPRGPDGEGVHVDPPVVMGHRRLSIIDISGGSQPMSTPDGRFTVVYNGEIYNYIELRAALEARGCRFYTTSDTEVLLQQFALDGPKSLQEFNGIFAFAIWDRDRQQLFLARDRMGVKPLYYTVAGDDLIFASEMKAMLAHPQTGREIDPLSVSKYFTYSYIPAPHSIFKGVNKLEPGTCLTFGRNGLHKTIYWDIPMEDNPVNTAPLTECAEGLRELLRDAVKKQLRSDVPVGVFLSGGIDSSSIAALASEVSVTRVHTFSVGFEESSYDESPFALEVARRYGTEHHHEMLSARRALDLLPDVMKILDEPFGDASILPTWMLSQFTARHVKVALGGDGGDELFAGYPSFQAHRIMEKLSILPTAWRERLISAAKKLPVSHRYASLDFLIQQFFKGAGVSPEIRFFLWMGCYGSEQKRGLLSSQLQEQLLRTNAYEDIINYVRQSRLTRDFERLQYLCMKLYMQDGILVKVDRASMANGLEVRVPFLDHNLVEYAAGMHPAYKLHGMKTKYVLKKAMENHLPASIIHRRKAGFMIPLASWLSGELRGMVEELCSEERLRADGLFDPVFVRRMLDDHYAKRHDHRKMIWTLLAFQLWKQNYSR
jgi:asparagine synthase (glutamine-hydrolysing)